MFPTLIKPSPLVFTFAIMCGVLVHDMNIDKASKVAFAPPAAMASTAAANTAAIDSMISKSEHTHVERASVGAYHSTMPKTQPPRDDDRRYVQNKKLAAHGSDDQTYIWPSV